MYCIFQGGSRGGPYLNGLNGCKNKCCDCTMPQSNFVSGYISPNRKRIAGDLLNSASDSLEQKVEMASKNSTGPITISQDGWSNVRNDPILATCLYVDGKSYL